MGKLKITAKQRLDDSSAAADEQQLHIQAIFLVEGFLLLYPNRQGYPVVPA
jgi:hypothetical protein